MLATTVTVDAELADILPLFLEQAEEDTKIMITALSEGDFETIQIKSHSLKGAGYGIPVIIEICKSINQAAKQENVSKISQELKKLEDYLARLEIRYE